MGILPTVGRGKAMAEEDEVVQHISGKSSSGFLPHDAKFVESSRSFFGEFSRPDSPRPSKDSLGLIYF